MPFLWMCGIKFEINDEDVIIDRDDQPVIMKRSSFEAMSKYYFDKTTEMCTHSGIPNTPCNAENCNHGCIYEKENE